MNVIQDCVATLKHLRQQIGGIVVQAQAADDCQCATQIEEAAAPEATMCGCGKDACQIGDGPDACRPRQAIQPIIAEKEVL